jgi:ketosteroid isomerase-like protein
MQKHDVRAASVATSPGGDGPLAAASRDRDDSEALAHRFVEAFNSRDADELVALAHRRIVFRPSTLAGPRRTYHGHDGLRRWMAELTATRLDFQVRIREIRQLGPGGFLVLSKVHVDGELLADAAMIATVHEGAVLEAHSYLTDELLLARLGMIPDATAPL